MKYVLYFEYRPSERSNVDFISIPFESEKTLDVLVDELHQKVHDISNLIEEVVELSQSSKIFYVFKEWSKLKLSPYTVKDLGVNEKGIEKFHEKYGIDPSTTIKHYIEQNYKFENLDVFKIMRTIMFNNTFKTGKQNEEIYVPEFICGKIKILTPVEWSELASNNNRWIVKVPEVVQNIEN